MKRDESGPRDLARNGAHFSAVLNQTKKVSPNCFRLAQDNKKESLLLVGLF